MTKRTHRQLDLLETAPPPIPITRPRRAKALVLLGALLTEALRQQADVAGRGETGHDQDHA